MYCWYIRGQLVDESVDLQGFILCGSYLLSKAEAPPDNSTSLLYMAVRGSMPPFLFTYLYYMLILAIKLHGS